MWYVHPILFLAFMVVSCVCSSSQVERHEGTCMHQPDMEHTKLTRLMLDANPHWCGRRRHRDDHCCCHCQGGTQVMHRLFSCSFCCTLGWYPWLVSHEVSWTWTFALSPCSLLYAYEECEYSLLWLCYGVIRCSLSVP
jgi:hypothetical protein